MADKSIHNRQDLSPEDAEAILRYAAGNMSDAEARELEARSLEDPFLADAMEGIESGPDKARMEQLAYSLNQDLKRRLNSKQKRKRWIGFETPVWWPWITLILLMLIIIAYLFIRKLSG